MVANEGAANVIDSLPIQLYSAHMGITLLCCSIIFLGCVDNFLAVCVVVHTPVG